MYVVQTTNLFNTVKEHVYIHGDWGEREWNIKFDKVMTCDAAVGRNSGIHLHPLALANGSVINHLLTSREIEAPQPNYCVGSYAIKQWKRDKIFLLVLFQKNRQYEERGDRAFYISSATFKGKDGDKALVWLSTVYILT